MKYYKKLDKHFEELKRLAEVLQPYTPPRHPKDDDISWLKNRDVIVDGVSMIINYSISDHGGLKTCILTLGSKQTPFIPLFIISKIAKLFLGTEHLTLFEYTEMGSKIYSWMTLLRKGVAVEHYFSEKIDKIKFNDLDFFRIDMKNKKLSITS